MRTTTLVTPHELVERDVAVRLEEEFDAAWFPEYNRCSITTADAFVAVDFDPEYPGRLSADERRALAAQVGFDPRTALHVQASKIYGGSASLAVRVAQMLCRLYDGVVLAE